MKPNNKRNLTPYQRFEQESRQIQDAPKSKKTAVGVRENAATSPPSDPRQHAFQPGAGPTDDDLAPETLIHEDGARSPREGGSNIPADETCRIVGADEIGAGYGFDEAELAQIQPLDEQVVRGNKKSGQAKAKRDIINP